LSEMKKEDTGLREETIEHAVKLYHRVLSDLILSGYSVNTGLFRAVPQFRGVVDNGQWDQKKNSIYVSFTQDKDLREAIAQTSVNILGEKRDAMYIIGGEDAATRATDGMATAGRNYTLNGRLIKVVGEHESVGITLTDASGKVSKLPNDMLVVNNPSQLIILLPSDLTDGDYTLTVTTQYSGTNTLLKTPRSTSKVITIGQSSGSEDGNTGDGGIDENPLG
ncbi:hypothetical protein DQJ18_24515, partial [Salmonella enterica subsp. enterica serovar Typhimurium]|nr:hypothetical protein [Salmonella enterica subsp. enterica serovar Typhimurium]